MALTIEQQRALAISEARRRAAEAGAGALNPLTTTAQGAEHPETQTQLSASEAWRRLGASFITGGATGLNEIAFSPNLVNQFGQPAWNWAREQGLPPAQDGGGVSLLDRAAEGSRAFISDNLYQPQSGAERAAFNVGMFLPVAAALPAAGVGGRAINIASQGVLPAAAYTAATEATRGTGLETPVGLAASMVGGGAGGLAANRLPRAQAELNASRALNQSGQTPQELAAALRVNPELMALDVNRNIHALSQAVAARPGAGSVILADAITQRAATRAGRTEQIFTDAAGASPNMKAELEALQATTRQNGDAAFGFVWQIAPPIDVSPAIATIDRLMPPITTPRPLTVAEAELARLRDALTAGGNGQLSDAQRIHALQSDLRRTIEAFRTSSNGAERLAARDLNTARQSIIDTIDGAVGGTPTQPGFYRTAQAQYADDIAVQDAFNLGWEILDNQRTIERSPSFWNDWVAGLSQPELDAARMAARGRLDTAIGTARNPGTAATALAEVDFNLQRMQALFGTAEAKRMEDLLKEEGGMAGSGNRLIGNSATAARLAAGEAMPVRAAGGRAISATGVGALGTATLGALAGAGQLSWKAAAGAATATALSAGWNKLARTLELNRDARFATMATARGQDAQDIWTRLGNPASPFRAMMQGAGVAAVPQLGNLLPQ
jgi:hypothetical protein